MNFSEKSLIKIGLVLICLIWGSTWFAIKVGLDSVPPLTAIVVRFILALVILYAIIKWRRLQIPRDRTTWNLFIAVGILAFSVPFGLIYWSAQFIPSGLMSILFAVYPFMVAILSHLFLPSEKITLQKVGGIVIGFGGIVLIFSHGLHWQDNHVFLGMFGVLASTVLQAYSLILVKKHGEMVDPILLNFGGMLSGTVLLFAGALLWEGGATIVLDSKAIGSIIYLGTFGSVVTFAIYFWLVKKMEVVYLSLISFVTPIVAVLIGAMFLQEVLQRNTFAGAGFVLLGLLVANVQKSSFTKQ